MRIAVNCPHCKRQMAASVAFAGQLIACPNCRGEFPFHPPASTPPPTGSANDLLPPGPSRLELNAAAERSAPPTSYATAIAVPSEPSPLPHSASRNPQAAILQPAPSHLAPPAPSASPPPAPANVARFKTASTAATTIAPSADGKLPGLLLADAEGAVPGQAAEKAIPLWFACLAVVGSTLLSVVLLLGDAPTTQTARSKHADARSQIAQFYGNDSLPLRPYQVLLREAQLAHSRGDRNVERQRYRQVLALLRAEKRSKYETITGTPNDDDQLIQCLSTLLSTD
jgi:hypothetical protein